MAASQISICNQALAELPAEPIASIDEQSLSARECKRFYDQVVSEMLEGPHDWSFAKVRVALAAVTNDRLGEWLFAYAMPSNVGRTLRLIPTLTNATGLVWPALDATPSIPFAAVGSTLYSSQGGAILEYVRSTIEPGLMSSMFARAVSLEMAARMAMPLKQSRELKGDLLRQAQIQKERAMADDQNRSPRASADYVSEVSLVRGGYTGPEGFIGRSV